MRGTNFKVLRIVTLFVKTNNFDSVNATRRPLFGKYVRTVLLTVDWIFFNFFFGLTLYLFNDGIFTTPWAWLMVNASFIPVLAFESRRSVSESRAIELDHVLRYTLNTIGIHALFLLSLTTLFDTHNLGAQFYVSYYVMLGVAVALWTLLSRHVIKKYRRRGMNFAKVVIVGTNTTARRLYEAMHSDPGYGYKVLGFFDHEWRQDFELPYCGSIDDLEAYVSDHDVDQVFFTIPGHDDVLSRVIKIADDNVMEFFYVPQISRYISRDFYVKSGQTISMSCSTVPGNSVYWIGIMDKWNNVRYVEGTGSLSHEFAVSSSGNYCVLVQNRGTVDITSGGNYYFY